MPTCPVTPPPTVATVHATPFGGGCKKASGGAEVTVGYALIADGLKSAGDGASTSTAVATYGDGSKTGWMQWPVDVIADPIAGGKKTIKSGAEAAVYSTLLLRRPLGYTGFTVFPSMSQRRRFW